jgi:hypothetical protein
LDRKQGDGSPREFYVCSNLIAFPRPQVKKIAALSISVVLLVSIATTALRDNDVRILASARRLLAQLLARHDRAFRDSLVSSIVADNAKTNGRDLHRLRAKAALACARIVPALPWIDLTNISTRGSA